MSIDRNQAFGGDGMSMNMNGGDRNGGVRP
jgi:hypothetical protein